MCAEHGLGLVDTGVVVDRDGGSGDVAGAFKRVAFPCRRCGAEAPVWSGKSCPGCGAEDLEVTPFILYD